MTLEERAEKAAGIKANGSGNCCQAVVTVLADQIGAPEELLVKAASGFGVGMGNMEATCGSLVGAVMTAGHRLDGKSAMRCARQISEFFRESCGAVTCRELKALSGGKPLCPCEDCVRNAVKAYAAVLGLD